jgi:hypothetical protein
MFSLQWFWYDRLDIKWTMFIQTINNLHAPKNNRCNFRFKKNKTVIASDTLEQEKNMIILDIHGTKII